MGNQHIKNKKFAFDSKQNIQNTPNADFSTLNDYLQSLALLLQYPNSSLFEFKNDSSLVATNNNLLNFNKVKNSFFLKDLNLIFDENDILNKDNLNIFY